MSHHRRISTHGLETLKHCILVGSFLDRADLSGMNLSGTNFTNTSFRGADLSYADLRGCTFIKADLSRADLHMANCEGADFSGADFSMSYLRATNFKDCRIWYAAFRRVIAKNAYFINTDLRGCDFVGAFLLGARFDGAKLDKVRNWHHAHLYWWMPPEGGFPVYEPREGYIRLDRSVVGDITLQENAARRKQTFE